MVQCLAVQLAEQLWSGQECMKSGKGKKAEGLLLLLAHLYNYKVCELPPLSSTHLTRIPLTHVQCF